MTMINEYHGKSDKNSEARHELCPHSYRSEDPLIFLFNFLITKKKKYFLSKEREFTGIFCDHFLIPTNLLREPFLVCDLVVLFFLLVLIGFVVKAKVPCDISSCFPVIETLGY